MMHYTNLPNYMKAQPKTVLHQNTEIHQKKSLIKHSYSESKINKFQ